MLSVHFLAHDADRLARLRPRLDAGILLTAGETPPAACHILVGGRPQRAQLAAAPRLQALIVPWAGIPEETSALLAEFPQVTLHNLHHNAAATAETALALLLAAAKLIVPIDQALRRHDWTPRYDLPPIVSLEGKTALILGFGAIGQRIARGCQGLGMSIIAVRRDVSAPAPADLKVEIHAPAALPDLLPRTHALCIALPLTPETRGVIGAAELAAMPPGGLLVNVGRGPIVAEQALYEALASHHLAAAGLDVWYRYPEDDAARTHTPPSAYPFHQLANVVMSPHRGGAFGAEETEARRDAELARLLNAAARGEPLPNRVDLARGY